MDRDEVQSKLGLLSAALQGQTLTCWDRIGTDPVLASLLATVEIVAKDLAAMADAMDLADLDERRRVRLEAVA
jgi:hypothetical protein